MAKVVWFRFQQCWFPLTCCFSKGSLKREILDSYLVTYFGIRNFGNSSAMSFIFSLKMFKI